MPTPAASTIRTRSRRCSLNERSTPYVNQVKRMHAAPWRVVAYASGLKPCSSAYFVTVMFSAQRTTIASSISSAWRRRNICPTLAIRFFAMSISSGTEITRDDIDALVGPATPHFAFQLRARVINLIANLDENDPVRRYGE